MGGCLVVVEPAGAIGGEKPIGMLTDRDIVTNVIVRESDPRGLKVDDVMTRHPVMIRASATLEDALQRMRSGATCAVRGDADPARGTPRTGDASVDGRLIPAGWAAREPVPRGRCAECANRSRRV